MIKYARTKDNRIVKVDVEDGIFTSKYEIVGELKDTIEELGDTAVVINNKTKKVVSITRIIKPDKYYLWITGDFTIYIAIWTDWGLKYVAKFVKGGVNGGKIELL